VTKNPVDHRAIADSLSAPEISGYRINFFLLWQ
jgi:hypothetical protein